MASAMNDNAPPPEFARRVPIIGTVGPGDVVTFDDTPAARAFLERVRRPSPPAVDLVAAEP